MRWARARIADVADRQVDLVLHLGDFGIWPGPSGEQYLSEVEAACSEHGVDLWITPGDHEDWGRLRALWADPENAAQPLQLTDHIRVLRRGYRFEMGGRTFVSLGGAPSVDLDRRSVGRDWWAEEMITPEDVEVVVAGGHADVMLAHDAPIAPYEVAEVARIRSGDDWGWSDRALAYARVGAERMHDAFVGVAPKLFVHGHYHVVGETTIALPGRGYDTRIWSLNCDGVDGNVRYLDLETVDST